METDNRTQSETIKAAAYVIGLKAIRDLGEKKDSNKKNPDKK